MQKVEFSLFNEEEYVLVYDEGLIFYNILSSTFVDEFKKVVKQWADSKGVDVFYNEDVVPEKIRSDRNVQTHLIGPLEDDESANSHKTHPSFADSTVPDYTEGPPQTFPRNGDESAVGQDGLVSTSQGTMSRVQLTTSSTEHVFDNAQTANDHGTSVPPTEPQEYHTPPPPDHRYNLPRTPPDRRHRGSIVDRMRTRFHRE